MPTPGTLTDNPWMEWTATFDYGPDRFSLGELTEERDYYKRLARTDERYNQTVTTIQAEIERRIANGETVY